jgi:hypothetical protein
VAGPSPGALRSHGGLIEAVVFSLGGHVVECLTPLREWLVVTRNAAVVPSGRFTDWISIGVLAGSLPRDVIDEAVAAWDRQAKRSDSKLPPHVVVYFVMALALFADDDYEEVLTKLAEPLLQWGCWDDDWEVCGSSGITQARQRVGLEPVKQIFETVCVPVAEELTRGAWLAGRRLVSIDGFEWDAPDSEANIAAFGYAGGKQHPSAFPKARVLTLVESASHAPIGVEIGPTGGKGALLSLAICWYRPACQLGQ